MTEDYRVPIQTKQKEMASEAANMYDTVYAYLHKTYLNEIDSMEIVPLKDLGVDVRESENFRLVEITRIVHDNKKSALENLLNILAALHPDYAVALIIKSDGNETKFYIGIRSSSQSKPASSGVKLLAQALEGSFPGSIHRDLREKEIKSVLDTEDIQNVHTWAMGSTSFIPSLKHDDAEQFSQGLERFIDAMYGKEYTAMILAEPINHEKLISVQTGYEGMATALSIHQKKQLSIGVNRSHALSDSLTKGITETLSESITRSQSYTKGSSTTESDSEGETVSLLRKWGISGAKYGGKKLGIPGLVIGGLIGGVVGKFMGSENKSTTKSTTTSESKADGRSEQEGKSRAESSSETRGSTSTTGESETINLEEHNKSIDRMIAKIDQQLKRIDESRSYGFWNASFYVLGDSSEAAHTACSLFKGILKGKDSTIEDSAITIWNNQNDEKRRSVLEYFENVVHPRFILPDADPNSKEQAYVTPSSLLSGKELALLMNFPRKSVSGTLVLEMPAFGRNVVYQSDAPEQAETIRLGCVHHYGKTLDKTDVRLSLDSLTMHTFISGSTGSGKTNAVYQMVKEIMRHDRKFLVIEPAKGEYKDMLGGNPDVHVFGTNPAYAPLLKLNPFEFPEGIHVLEHVDRLVEIFNACWPMYAAMPAILKSGIEDAYRKCGWNLEYSICTHKPSIYPSIALLSDLLPDIIRASLYSDETKGDYSGALVTRVNSLNNGLTGLIFTDQSIDNEILFDSNCIIDLSRVGSVETKALLMGIVFLKLHEYRQSKNAFSKELRHITVIEEAHHLLRKTSQDQYMESANLQGKSVEMITNAIAEMRAYGEGFIIVDQSPGLLDPAVIRNTNTKIILRLPEKSDRETTGSSAFLNEAQIAEIPRLSVGVAAVFQNNWMTPVLCKIDYVAEKKPFEYEHDIEGEYAKSMEMTSKLLGVLLKDLMADPDKKPEKSISKVEYDELITFIKEGRFRSKPQLVNLLEDMKNGVSNEIMQEENSLELSKLLHDVIGYDSIIREAKLDFSNNYDDWTDAVMSILQRRYQISDEDEQLTLIGLMLEQEKVKSEQGRELYENWNEYLMHRIFTKGG